jgi:hypothetical protein
MYDRGFKGLKQAIKLEFKLGKYSDVRFPLTAAARYSPLLGRRTLQGTLNICQVRRYAKLFRKVDQQHAGLYRKGLG